MVPVAWEHSRWQRPCTSWRIRHRITKAALRAAHELKPIDDEAPWSRWRSLIQEVRLAPNHLTIRLERASVRARLGLSALHHEDPATATIDLLQPIRLHRTAHELRLVIPSDAPTDEAGQRYKSLVKVLARGRRWYRQITSGEMPSIQAIAKAENVTERYVARVLRGSLLAPDLMQRILDGRQPVDLTVKRLLDPPPLAWSEQRPHFGLPFA